jgi:hypothetical protein
LQANSISKKVELWNTLVGRPRGEDPHQHYFFIWSFDMRLRSFLNISRIQKIVLTLAFSLGYTPTKLLSGFYLFPWKTPLKLNQNFTKGGGGYPPFFSWRLPLYDIFIVPTTGPTFEFWLHWKTIKTYENEVGGSSITLVFPPCN